MTASYTRAELVQAYDTLGMDAGDLVYVAANLLNLGLPPWTERREILESHYGAIREVVGETGTIVVPTYTFSYCNTDKVFDVKTTPSETGPLTEYVRSLPGAVRQFHPFSSRAAVGPAAEELCGDCSRHANGPDTPFARMLARNPKILSIGLEPRLACSVVHHVEMEMGVPYRYVKEFIQPVVVNDAVEEQPFYLYVTYRDCDIEKNGNVRIMEHFAQSNEIRSLRVGNGKVHMFDMERLVESTRDLMKQDIYCVLERSPTIRPYSK
jgi:aminoglycoside 3-N-acetyltransferase